LNMDPKRFLVLVLAVTAIAAGTAFESVSGRASDDDEDDIEVDPIARRESAWRAHKSMSNAEYRDNYRLSRRVFNIVHKLLHKKLKRRGFTVRT
jgi:hypothetical protein